MNGKHEIGVVGLGVMGRGIARNWARKGFSVACQSLDREDARRFYENLDASEKQNLTLCDDPETLVNALSSPRRLALSVPAGAATDEAVSRLSALLSPGDLIMDLGNAFYRDTERRKEFLTDKGIYFMGVGVSGGERGALEGPSVMAGGEPVAWEIAAPLLNALAAAHPVSGRCCGYFGQGGAGHFVKMAHNGIEYAYMEILAEIYRVTRDVYGLSAGEAADVFAAFRADESVSSYLVEITEKILRKKDDLTGEPLIDMISDRAGNKGTGQWLAESAIALGVAAPTLAEALSARYLSAERPDRARRADRAATENAPRAEKPRPPFDAAAREALRRALEFSQYICFDQGIRVIRKAAEENGWTPDFSDILRVWENGCVIRTAYARHMKEALEKSSDLVAFGLQGDAYIGGILRDCAPDAIEVCARAMRAATPVFCLASAINDYHGLDAHVLPTALIQAQRDFFSAHTYARTDRAGAFHTRWE